jgi:DNA-binding CsgD family transcriptional regulator
MVAGPLIGCGNVISSRIMRLGAECLDSNRLDLEGGGPEHVDRVRLDSGLLDVERLELLDLFDQLREAGPDPALWRSRCAQGFRSLLSVNELLFIDVSVRDSRPELAWLSQDLMEGAQPVLASTPSDAGWPNSLAPMPGSNGHGSLALNPMLEDFIQGIDSWPMADDSTAAQAAPAASPVERLVVRQCQLKANHRVNSSRRVKSNHRGLARTAVFQALPAAHLANHWLVLAYPAKRTLRNPLAGRRVKSGLVLLVKISESLGRSLAPPEHPSPSLLPPRCSEVLQLILLGQSDQEIGQQLNMAHDTVRGHVRNIFRIFNVNTRSRLMGRWIEFAQSRQVNTRSNQ